ncbi:MAG TPA: phosphatase PAP2 family protein [Thermoanaerobaculia bacterium]|nr:phosphatase PAP2 family protein [Thermoanaerobaculia bacterium]
MWKRVVSFDEALLLGVRRWESDFLTRFMKTLTHLGDTSTWVVVGLALALSGGNGPRLAALLALGATIAVLTSQVLKRLCCRPRPSSSIGGFASLTENPDAFSFPSGHTAAAFGIAVALAGEGSALGALTLTLASGIAISRVYLGAHYPLDVAAGTLVGVLAGLTARLVIFLGA